VRPRLLGLAASFAVALHAAAAAAAEPTPGSVLDAFEGAFRARDVARYLALWDFETPEARAEEAEFFGEAVSSPANQLILRRAMQVPENAELVRVPAQVLFVSEPRARVEQWALLLERGPSGWTIRERQSAGRIDGLVHLSLDPAGYRAAGLTLKFEDFELTMSRGTLFMAPQSLGPTVLVFVGDGTVRVSPRPETEREQLRQFCGHTELVEKVDRVFVRLHPADLASALTPMRLDPDPESARRFEAAQRFYRMHSERTFVLDGSLPGSPWWVMPALGDSLVVFDAGRRGTLTFAINSSLPESISLFDRARRLQVCLYPSGGREATYSEDDGREVDILSHDLRARFDPRQRTLQGQDTLRVRLLNPMSTLRLRLDEGLAVESVTSADAGPHLYFRVRGQNSLMVALGPLGVAAGEIALTVRYAGTFTPEPVDSEIIQAKPGAISAAPPGLTDDAIWIEKVEVFSNRNAWYPQTSVEDYALATLHLETPAGFAAVAGGERTSASTDGDRTVTEYRQDRPARYLTVAVGRLVAAGSRREGDVSLNAFAVSRERDLAARELERAGDILRFYSREFGPCPYPSVSLVLIQGQVPGGHSPAGMVVLARKPTTIHREYRDDPTDFSDVPGFFLAHELAHQWWGQGVGPKNYRERWLSEGAAQYAAALWVRQAQGEDAFQAVLKRMARWASRESASGPIHLGYRLRLGHIKGNPEIFRAVVYDKGAYVLHMLRGIVGEDVFRRAVTTFLERNRFEKVGSGDLQAALESESGLDLAPYFKLWIFGTALPRLRYSHHTARVGAQYRTTVEVSAENVPGPIPLELAVTHQIGRAVLHVMLPPQGGRFSVDTPSEPRKVEINGDRGVLAWIGS
jgi:hypothetical protein